MKISKQLNNNIVIASDSQGREVVLMGKGIGFGCKVGSEPGMSLVEKQFFGLSSGDHIQQLAELLERIPLEHLSLGMEVAEHIQEKIKNPLNETLVLLISDHISFALERRRKGLDLSNALLWESKKFYPEEYRLGLDALDIIERSTDVRLREDEAGFLAMHIVNAQYGSGDLYGIVSVMYPKAAACVEKIADYLRAQLDYSLSPEEEGYLIIHVERITRP